MDNPTLFSLNIATLTLIVFTAHLLFLRSFQRQVYLPLALCLLSFGLVICQPALVNLSANIRANVLIFSLPALLLIAPTFWFYVDGITAKSVWRMSFVTRRHFTLFLLGLFIAILALLLPSETKYALLIEGNDSILKELPVLERGIAVFCLVMTLVLVLAWIVQSGFYFIKVIKRLSGYRRYLKDVFASTESKEARWLSWLLLAIGVVWTAAAINIILDNLFFSTHINASIAHFVMLIMVWSIAVWGLRQKPGLEELYRELSDNPPALNETEATVTKYQRSALDQAHSQRIAEKLSQAMEEDKLYLDASLSLPKLAKQIGSTPNYISQTLNGVLETTFFDYVNHHRVKAAKLMLRESNDTVLDIAMNVGFNAKSSFYNAFKKETQQTPTQYRKHERPQV